MKWEPVVSGRPWVNTSAWRAMNNQCLRPGCRGEQATCTGGIFHYRLRVEVLRRPCRATNPEGHSRVCAEYVWGVKAFAERVLWRPLGWGAVIGDWLACICRLGWD